jgi:hypothetical protein
VVSKAFAIGESSAPVCLSEDNSLRTNGFARKGSFRVARALTKKESSQVTFVCVRVDCSDVYGFAM